MDMDLRTHDVPSISARALLERPLASLPPAQASAFVAALMAPGQRFARAFHQHHRVRLGQPHAVATASTLESLAGAARGLLGELGYPRVHTLGFGAGAAYRPVALFALRELEWTPWAPGTGQGRHPERNGTPRSCASRGPFALASSLGLLDEHAHLDVVKALLLSIVNKALARGQRRVFVLCADGCLRDVLSHFGVDFRPALVAPDALHQVGCFDLESIDNLERLYEVAYSLGRALELSAA